MGFKHLFFAFATSICLFSKVYSFDLFEGSRLELGYNTGKWISLDEDYSEASLFTPYARTYDWIAFSDIHAYRFNDGKWGASLGLGTRYRMDDDRLFGINAYYDYRRAFATKSFHQAGLGLEWLTPYYDVRVNGYLPIYHRIQHSHCEVFDSIEGDFFAKRCHLEYAYSGIELEVGAPFLNDCDFSLYGASGPYYYACPHVDHFWGGYARLELGWKSIVSCEIRASYDKVYSTKVQGIFKISIPLDWSSLCSLCECESLFTQPVKRNGVILTEHCCDWKWNW